MGGFDLRAPHLAFGRNKLLCQHCSVELLAKNIKVWGLALDSPFVYLGLYLWSLPTYMWWAVDSTIAGGFVVGFYAIISLARSTHQHLPSIKSWPFVIWEEDPAGPTTEPRYRGAEISSRSATVSLPSMNFQELSISGGPWQYRLLYYQELWRSKKLCRPRSEPRLLADELMNHDSWPRA